MRKLLAFVVLAFSIIFAGSWVAAQAQTGDCYLMLPGCLDSSFGSNGKVSEPAGMKVNGVAIQSVGGEARIVTVGQIGSAWAIVRYLPKNDSLPTSFLDTTFGGDHNGIIPVRDSGSGTAYGAVVQPDDNMLIVVGSVPTQVVYQHKTYVRDQLFVFRYDQNGLLDPSFGSGGKVRVSDPDFPASPTVGRAVALQSDRKIVVLGSYNGWPAVVRLNPNGTLDNTFDGDGQYIYLRSVSAFFAIAIQNINSEERIVVGVEYRPGGGTFDFSLFRLTSNGALDTTFGNGGVVTTHRVDNAEEYYEGLAVDSQQRILAAGEAYLFDSPTPKMYIARYTASGALDDTFGGMVSPPPGLRDAYAHAVAIQPDSRIVVAGSTSTYDNLAYMSAWRFNVDGSPDLSFGNNGWVTTDLPGSSASATAIALQPDGMIVLAGNVTKPTSKPLLARYFGYLPPQWDHDIAVNSISATPVLASPGEPVLVQVAVGNNGRLNEIGTISLTESPGGAISTQSFGLGSGEATLLTFWWPTSTSTARGNHTLVATAAIPGDQQLQNNSRSTAVDVEPPVTIVLSARAYRDRTSKMVDLMWNGTSADQVDIYKEGAKYKSVPNTGKYTDWVGTNKSTGTLTYKVCEPGSTTRCSLPATVVF